MSLKIPQIDQEKHPFRTAGSHARNHSHKDRRKGYYSGKYFHARLTFLTTLLIWLYVVLTQVSTG